ncbi:hypothetical protein F5887DRAFT_597958 [Amanita rubescens]|nr:hypothetical protein F5887DRAFT_597958 [Amanita rubescens]
MTLTATILSLSGVMLFLQALVHPDLHIVICTSSVIVLFLSLFGRRGLSSSPPFNCQLSWPFFRRFRQGSERSTCRGLSLPLFKPISLRTLVPQALASRDWLEQDCFNFSHPNNIGAIDVLLADALVWIDSNPKIKKTSELVVSIYLCLSDLEHGRLEPTRFSINLACRLLTLARNRLASGRYLIGTFDIVRLLMSDKQNAAAKDVQQAIFAVLDECRLYFKTGEYKNHYHQAQLCVDELYDLIRAGKEPGISLPHYWAGILGRAVDVHGMAGDIMTGPSSEQGLG